MPKRALIFWGGWDGHQPEAVADLFREILTAEGFETKVTQDLESLGEAANYDLLVPVITMATINPEPLNAALTAVREQGVGLAGAHGGMCDAFRNESEWQFATGGQWVAHPGNDGVRYRIRFADRDHEITQGLDDFEVESEQYYLHTDPGNHVLAVTDFPLAGVAGPHVANPCAMPQVWTKMYGQGRVFYNALGHQCNVLESGTARELMRRGFLWAAR